ncbi:MarR family transcriptional regulator [Alcaligenaceae bacterium]|nr:MarR family transcriptional regulator [Alcaligenaceae bacterium]
MQTDKNNLAPDSEEALHCTLEMVFFVHLHMAECADEVLAKLGLGRTHHRILHFAARKPGISVNELLEILSISNQAMSRSTSQLMSKGLLEQRYSAEDRRVRQHYVTAQGAAFLEDLTRQQLEVIRRSHQQLSAQQVHGFWDVLDTMIRPNDRKWVTAQIQEIPDTSENK